MAAMVSAICAETLISILTVSLDSLKAAWRSASVAYFLGLPILFPVTKRYFLRDK